MFRRRLLWESIRRAFRLYRWRAYGCYSNSSRSSWRYWFRWRPGMLVAFAGFSFREKGISDDVIQDEKKFALSGSEEQQGWEVVVDNENVRVFRRQRPDSSLYEYRCVGSYGDISAKDFVDAQVDLSFRQKWDANVVKLEVLQKDDETESEVVRWIAKFPYPMYPREYVYVRRRHLDEDGKCMVIASSSLEEDEYPASRDYVRVSKYHSVMVVHPHSAFSDKGLDYVVTYYDDPESNIPSYAYNWILNHGGPHFLEQVHSAALELEQQRLETTQKTTTVMVTLEEREREEEGEEEDILLGGHLTAEPGALSLSDAGAVDVTSDIADVETADTAAPAPVEEPPRTLLTSDEETAADLNATERQRLFAPKEIDELFDVSPPEELFEVNEPGPLETANDVHVVGLQEVDPLEGQMVATAASTEAEPLESLETKEVEPAEAAERAAVVETREPEEESQSTLKCSEEDVDGAARQYANLSKISLLRERIKAYLLADFPLANAPELLKLAD